MLLANQGLGTIRTGMTKDTKKSLLEEALLKLHGWIQHNGWAGYDPYDIKHWQLHLPRFLRKVKYLRTLASLPLRIEKYYPYEIRHILGIKQRIYPMAMGLFAESYTNMYQYFGDEKYLEIAEECAQWLMDNVDRVYRGYGWGLPIDWQSRILIPAGTPCGTVSAICGDGFLKLYEVTKDKKYLDICCRICEGFIHSLNVDELDSDTLCFSYTPLDNFHVHNLNLMIAVFLTKMGKILGEPLFLGLGMRAANYALKEQRKDGSISYWSKDQSATFRSDSYHSGFEIRALHSLWELTKRHEYRLAAERYYNYYRNNFLGEDGAVWRNSGNPNITDIHGCVEAMICNAQLRNEFTQASEILENVAQWAIANMQSAGGYFIYRIVSKSGKKRRIDIPYIRWGQAWMMKALTVTLGTIKSP